MDVDSDSDEGDSSLLLGNDDVVQVSEPPPLFVDINLPVSTADAGLAQDGAGQPPAASATAFASKGGWLKPMNDQRYFIGRRTALVEFFSII